MLKILTISLLLCPWSISFGAGQLLVAPASTTITFPNERNITVKNTGDAPMYINISLHKIENPGVTPEKKIPISALADPMIIASPTKVSLGAGQSRSIKLTALKAPLKEQAYRLYVIPVSSFSVTDSDADKRISAPTVVSVGYGVLVRALPSGSLTSELVYECQSEGIRLSNTGNSRADLSNISFGVGKMLDRIGIYPSTPVIIPHKSLTAKFKGEDYSISCK
ncbi:hypothetical protein [Providencia burhodogranariea]|uniref:Pilus assembly protein n=1 Tax=Providencia burhodogranariea DSM 19968 TaxID=1141662 RepID=K8WN09_9GAMM|nr:hypothetical protein [Providencia burhodogranariea]EKT61998.1 hypothetical protein OOA_08906 [Providencia burhodogranariea DSM 19968]